MNAFPGSQVRMSNTVTHFNRVLLTLLSQNTVPQFMVTVPASMAQQQQQQQACAPTAPIAQAYISPPAYSTEGGVSRTGDEKGQINGMI
jgi:hypothetical protein